MRSDNLTIYMLTYNRPAQAYDALISILNQSDKNFQLVVSDNSSDLSFQKRVSNDFFDKGLFSRFQYIKRKSVFTAIDHWNVCLSEVKSDYFCLFHDDDLMHPNFVENFWDAQAKFPNAVAFGGNAILRSSSEPDKPIFEGLGAFIRNLTSKKLLNKYFSRYQLGIAPFPSYIYQKCKLEGLSFNFGLGGKYCDVTWLLEVASRGEMIWINKIMMTYCMHSENYGITESRADRLSFLSYLKKNIDSTGTNLLSDYRFFIYKKFYSSLILDVAHKKKGLLMYRYMKRYRVLRFFRLDHFFHLIVKIYIRSVNTWLCK